MRARGRLAYWASTERDADPERLPDQPAALRVYDDHGCTRCLVADFDTKQHSAEQVAADAAAFSDVVRAAGGVVVADISPTGGRHVYVPLASAAPYWQARAFIEAAARRYPSLDITPMTNVSAGLIRPPGSRHPSGGYQLLTTPHAEAAMALSRRTSAAAWDRMSATFGVGAQAPEVPGVDFSRAALWQRALLVPARFRYRRPLQGTWARMAATGEYDTDRWGTTSTSEPRLALLRALWRAGYSFADLTERIDDGRFAGLWSFYTHSYRTQQARRSALASEWVNKATTVTPLPAPTDSDARKIDTREPPTHRPGGSASEYAAIREWWTVITQIESARWPGRRGLTTRQVLRALAAAAQSSGSMTISFGVRSLAEGAGLDHSTVAAALAALRDDNPQVAVLERVETASKLDADTYTLRVPPAHADLTKVRWVPGIVHRIHPVFRLLPQPAWLVYEALVVNGPSLSTLDLSALTGLPARTTQEAMKAMGEVGLVVRTGAGWVRADDINDVAAELGAIEAHAAVQAAHRADRAAWRTRVARAVQAELDTIEAIWRATLAAEPISDVGGSPQGVDSHGRVMALLARELGAELVHA